MYDREQIQEYGSFRDDLANKPQSYRNISAGLKGKNMSDGAGHLTVPSPIGWNVWQEVLRACYASITMVDAAGGKILSKLAELGLAENTLVVWTTDHGDALASHGGHVDKESFMTEEVFRIPMAFRWPGHIQAGVKNASLVSNIDLGPTLLAAAGTAYRGKTDGQSLLPLLTGVQAKLRDDLLCETHGHHQYNTIGRMLVTDRYKYIATQGDRHELYDLQTDPYELTNLIDDPVLESVRTDLRHRLMEWQRRTKDDGRVL